MTHSRHGLYLSRFVLLGIGLAGLGSVRAFAQSQGFSQIPSVFQTGANNPSVQAVQYKKVIKPETWAKPGSGKLMMQQVGNIEQNTFGHEYTLEMLPARVLRLENRIFGKPNLNLNLQQRVERLVSAWEVRKLSHDQVPRETVLLEYLEKRIFGNTWNQDKIPNRLSRLEQQVFGETPANAPARDRLQRLLYATPLDPSKIRLSRAYTDATPDQPDSTDQGDPLAPVALGPVSKPRSLAARSAPPVTRPANSSAIAKASVPIDSSRTARPVIVSAAPAAAPIKPLPAPTPAAPDEPDNANDFNYTAQMHPIQQNTHALRWMTSPVNIYVQTDDALGLNDSVIRQALEAWQSSVAITRVAKAQDADIVVETSLPGPSKGPVTYPVFQAGNTANKMRTIMLINLTQYRQLGPLPLAASRLQAALTHQLGHALGLWGHSTQPTDIMYPGEAIEAHDLPDSWSTTKASPVPVYKAIGSRSVMPSPRDTATLQRIYTRPGRDLGEMLPFEEP